MLYFILLLQIFIYFLPIHYVNPKIEPYYKEFFSYVYPQCRKDQINYPKQTVIDFGSMPDSDDIGYCVLLKGVRFKITLNKKYFDKATEEQRFILVAHELTHCVFLRDHSASPFHYMYWRETGVRKNDAIYQLQEIINHDCKK